MNEDFGVPLAEFAAGKTQPELAELIGVSQSAVSQMFKSGREIRVRKKDGSGYQAIEIKPVGDRRKRVA
ncbi:MAG: helix-turn-helix domain-containing protein [Aeromonas sp.]|nr:helix-turn-helix domain-containing protein [Aeromonas sp.]